MDCPHCSVAIPDVMSKEDHLKRLTAKTDENKALSDALKETRTKASGYDALVAERDGLQSQLSTLTEATARGDAFRERGLSADLLSSFELFYNSAQAGADEPVPFADWLDGAAREHVMLSSHFTAPANPATPADPAAPHAPKPPPPTPVLDTGAETPPAAGGKMTPAQTREHLRSLPPAEAKAYMEANPLNRQ